MTDVLKEKDRKNSTIVDVLTKKIKRKKEGNSTPRSPFILRIKRSKTMTSRRHRSVNKRTEKGDDSIEGLEGLQMKTTCTGEASQRDDSYDLCIKCKKPGLLMHCDGMDCKRCYHLSCIDPPLSEVRFGMWLCVYCLQKKMEVGVYSVSQGIESILDSRNELRKGMFYLVKYKGLAHIHNHWIPSNQLLRKAPLLLTKFNKKQQSGQHIEWKQEWTEPHRLLQRRYLVLPEQIDVCCSGHDDSNEFCYVEWLVKWKGLGYEYCTWEFKNSDFLCSANGMALIDEFERRRVEARKEPIHSQIIKDLCLRENLLKNLSMLVDELPIEHNKEFLISVCNIIRHWHKNRNTILIPDQEAKIKSIVFISYLLSYRCLPFLIISTIPALSKWEAEFAHLAPSINVVVYSGNKNTREMIRSLEFYEEGGSVMFQVLITSPDVIVKDLRYLDCLGWEGIIIDDYQHKDISKHFDKFAILSEFKLLISNGEPKGSEPALSYNPDPLENQMTMACPWEYLIAHSHQKRKLNLAEECKKELEEVRKKYNLLSLNEEAMCNQHLKLVKELQCTTHKSLYLAELLKSNFAEPYKHGNSEEVQGEMGNLMRKLPKKNISKMPTSPLSSSSCQMGNFMRKLTKKDISKIPTSPSSSSAGLPPPGMG